MEYRAAVITMSDKGSQGLREDTAGDAVVKILEDNGWKIEITETICPDLPAQEEYEWDIAQNTVTFPLVLRSRQAGDQLRLPGRRTKTLKKWYIDEKIPRQNRQSLPVLADESGLLAAAGLGPNYPRLAQPGQPALHIRLTPKTKPEERT